MRESLIAFIRSVQERSLNNDWRGIVQIGDNHGDKLWCGYGYFSIENVLYWSNEEAEEMTVDHGVDKLLSSLGL